MEDSRASCASRGRLEHAATWRLVSFALLVGLWLFPWTARLRHPSITSDDVYRIGFVQDLPFSQRLTQPFNEHVAPFFELVTTVAWQFTGNRLSNAPLVYTLASYLPFILCLALGWLLVRREWGSAFAANVTVSLFATTAVYAECVYWFSASTFMWALAFTVGGLLLVGEAIRTSSRGLWIAGCGCCLLAPMSSSIGLLAGPACLLRAWPGDARRDVRGALRALWPLLASLLFLAGASRFDYAGKIGGTIRATADVGQGLAAALQSPAYLVLQGFVGVVDPQQALPFHVLTSLTVAGFAVFAMAFANADGRERRWMAIGTFLIVSGYLATDCVRTHIFGPEILLRVQRYHLFPCAGFALLVCAVLAPRLIRLEPARGVRLLLPGLICLGLIALNAPVMARRLGAYRRHPDQASLLETLDRLANHAAERGYSREDVISALDPIEPPWANEGYNVVSLLPLIGREGDQVHRARPTRDAILDGMTTDDRARLLAYANVSSHLTVARAVEHVTPGVPGELARRDGARAAARPGEYEFNARSSFLEFQFAREFPGANTLELGALECGKTLELWWAGRGEAFSRARCVVIRAPAEAPSEATWRLPLAELPSLRPDSLRAVRILARKPGRLRIDTPVLRR
jgi:hypothetical protein